MRRMKGFTLVEIMIVVAIIGLLVAIGVPGFIKARDNARKNTCYNNMRVIAHAVQQYTIDNNYPSDSTITIYGTLMPTTDARDPDMYVPNFLKCPEADLTYGAASGEPDVNNTTLDVTCPATAKSHGTFGDLD
ncbi:MAG: type II secretion system protein [Candidatus Aureabacteria bacterium]|nr:type II secretion system protein [Candidatus Auribacterota bacterium]